MCIALVIGTNDITALDCYKNNGIILNVEHKKNNNEHNDPIFLGNSE